MESEEVEEKLAHCIYASTASEPFSFEEIETLLREARKKNAQLGVTGMLLYDNGSFFQVLEGAPENVQGLYDVISADKRHRRVTKLIYEPIEARDFADWSMGHADVSRAQLAEVEGLNDFFRSGKCFTELDNSLAKKLLRGFKEGRWRMAAEEEG